MGTNGNSFGGDFSDISVKVCLSCTCIVVSSFVVHVRVISREEKC